MNKTLKSISPAPLKKGETIGIIAPAGPVNDREAFAAGARLIEEMGFRIKHRPDIFRKDGYLAGSDQERLAELHALFADPEVKALVAARGGYGCLRLLADLDFALIRANPKMLIGFSDLTVLHAAIGKQTGLVTLHGPMLATLARGDRETRESFFRWLSGCPETKIKARGLEILRGGDAAGRLLPGNLACLCHLLATPWEPDWQGAILVLEDIGEPPYRLDRLLTQLAVAGKLKGIAGLILGDFGESEASETVWRRALELLPENIPVWGNFPCGHGSRNLTLPLGAEARLDSSAGVLAFPRMI